MPIASILLIATQLVQAGFSLEQTVAEVKSRQAAGATDQDIHDYLRKLAHDALDKLLAA